MSKIADFALQAGQGVVGAGLGLALQRGQDRRQIRQQQKLTNMEIGGQKQMVDYNYQKQLDMWKATNYEAQMQELKTAGLNPGLIYGMGGTGGATTGQPIGNVTGGHAPTGGGEAIAGMQMAATLGLMRAQKENIEADTANKEADTANKPIVGKSIETGTKKMEGELKGIELNNEFLKKSLWDRLDIINTEANKAIAELDIKEGERDEERATRMKRIEGVRAQAAGEILKNVLIEAQTKATGQTIEESKSRVIQMEAQIQKWAAEITQMATNLDRQERELILKRWEAGIKASFPGLGQSLGRLLNGAMEQISTITTGEALPKYEVPGGKKQ